MPLQRSSSIDGLQELPIGLELRKACAQLDDDVAMVTMRHAGNVLYPANSAVDPLRAPEHSYLVVFQITEATVELEGVGAPWCFCSYLLDRCSCQC